MRFITRPIVAKVKSITGGSPEDKDLVKTAIAQVFMHGKARYKTIKKLEFYLNKVITGVCVDEQRRKKKIRLKESIVQEHYVSLHEQNRENEKKRLTCEFLTKLAIEILPEQSKQVYLMAHIHEMTNQKIAEELNISRRTVEYHRSEAYKKLRIESHKRPDNPREMFLPTILSPLIIASLFIKNLLP